MSDLGFLEEELKAVMEEVSKYSACDKKYTDGIDNYAKLESIRLSREKFNLDYEERIQKLALMNQQAVWEHEEKMEKIKLDQKNSTKSLLGVIIPSGVSLFSVLCITHAEQTQVIVSKALSFIIKPKI